MSKLQVEIGKRIRAYRTQQSLSQEELAEKCGLHPTYIGQIERGEKNATLESVHKISCALSIPLSTLSALSQHGIYYCSIDDFCTAGTEELKRAVLFAELEKHLSEIIGKEPMELTRQLYQATKVSAFEKEMEYFCNRYVKTLRLKVNTDGVFAIEIQK